MYVVVILNCLGNFFSKLYDFTLVVSRCHICVPESNSSFVFFLLKLNGIYPKYLFVNDVRKLNRFYVILSSIYVCCIKKYQFS